MQLTNSEISHQSSVNFSVILVITLFIVLALAAPFGLETTSYLFFKNYVASLGVILLFMFWLWQSRQICWVSFNWTWEKLPLLLLFIWGSLSLIWAGSFDYAIGKWMLWLLALLMFWLATHIELNQHNLIKLSIGLVVSADIVAMTGVGQYLFDPNNYFLPQSHPPGATFGNKNGAAQMMVLLFPLTLFLLFSQISKVKTWFSGLSAALILVYVFYTDTRAAWLGISIEFIFIFGLLYWQRKDMSWAYWTRQKTIASITSLIVFLVLINFSSQGFTPVLEVFDETTTSITESVLDSSAPRYKIWQASANMISDAPWFGHGLGNFFHNMFNEGYATGIILSHNAHNDFLELFVELGVVGVLLLFAFIVAMLMIWKRLIVQQIISQHWFYSLIIVALSGSFVNMMFSFPYQMSVPLVIFGLFVGLFLKGTEPLQHSFKNKNYHMMTAVAKSLSYLCAIFVLVAVLSIYQNWMNVFLKINNNATQQISEEKFSNPQEFQVLIEQPERIMLLDGLAKLYLGVGEYDTAFNLIKILQIDTPGNGNQLMQNIILYWMKSKNLNQALSVTQEMQDIKDVYLKQILLIKIYQKMGNISAALKAYQQLKTKPEASLAVDKATYQALHANAVTFNKKADAVYFYQKFVRYHGYDFDVEDDMAFFYAKQQDFKNTAKHYKKIIKHNPEEANKNHVNFLIKQGLLPKDILNN